MHRVWFAAIALAVTLYPGLASAEALDARDLFRRAEALVQSLIGAPPADRGIIHPPGDIDPKMALMPPAGGTMRLLVPPDRLRQQ